MKIFTDLSGVCLKAVGEFDHALESLKKVNNNLLSLELEISSICRDIENEWFSIEELLKKLEMMK